MDNTYRISVKNSKINLEIQDSNQSKVLFKKECDSMLEVMDCINKFVDSNQEVKNG